MVPLFIRNPNWLGLSIQSAHLVMRRFSTFSKILKGVSVRLMGR